MMIRTNPRSIAIRSLVTLVLGLALLGSGIQAAEARVAYALNALAGTLTTFTVDPPTGALTAAASTVAGAGPRAFVVDPTVRFLYVANAAGTVSAFRIDQATGALTPLPGANVGAGPRAIVADPTGRFLYVALDTGRVALLRIAPSGQPIASGTFTVAGSPRALAMHPSGRFLYMTDVATNSVRTLSINVATGALTGAQTLASGGVLPIAIAADPLGRFVHVANRTSNVVAGFRVNATSGLLTAVSSTDVKDPVSLAIHPTGRFLYAASPDNDAVFGHAIDRTSGALAFVDVEVLAQPEASALGFDPSGRFLYVAHESADQVTRLTINGGTGGMTQGQAVAAGNGPVAVAVIHPGERFLFATTFLGTNQNERITAFRASAGDGTLTQADVELLDETIIDVATHPGGRFVYASGWNGASITGYSVGLAAGDLTPFQTLELGEDQISGLAIDPTGRLLYVACSCENGRVRLVRIDPVTGLMTPTTITAGASGFLISESVAVDPSGRFLFVAWQFEDVVDVYAIEPVTGGLTLVESQPTGNAPGQVVVDPLGRFVYVVNLNPSGVDTVAGFRVGATGALTPAGTLSHTSAARGAVVDPTGRFLVVGFSAGASPVHVHAIDPATGALSFVTSNGGVPPVSVVAMDATGRFVYVGLGANEAIAKLTLDPADGDLVTGPELPMDGSPLGLVTSPRMR